MSASLSEIQAKLDSIPVEQAADMGRFSPLEKLAHHLGPDGVHDIKDRLHLTDAEIVVLAYHHYFTARPAQLHPLDTPGWKIRWAACGRGFGKTHSASVGVLEEAMADPEARILLVGPSLQRVLSVQIESGPSSIMKLAPPWFIPTLNKSAKLLTFPNGATCQYEGSTEAGKFRGAGFSAAFADEAVDWHPNRAIEVWKEILRTNRHRTKRMVKLGLTARVVLTSTPKPSVFFRHLIENHYHEMTIIRGSTLENPHLDPSSLQYARRLHNTPEGQLEFGGVLKFESLSSNTFARVDWNKHRVSKESIEDTTFNRIIISIDPSTAEKKRYSGQRDSTGLACIGFRKEEDGLTHSYILAAERFPNGTPPEDWIKRAVELREAWEPYTDSKITTLIERNQGGIEYKSLFRAIDPKSKIRLYQTKTPKEQRAASWAALATVGLVHLVGHNRAFEKQLASFAPGQTGADKDDMVDAAGLAIVLYSLRANRGALAANDAEQLPDEEEDED